MSDKKKLAKLKDTLTVIKNKTKIGNNHVYCSLEPMFRPNEYAASTCHNCEFSHKIYSTATKSFYYGCALTRVREYR